jgi:hypothetical protein
MESLQGLLSYDFVYAKCKFQIMSSLKVIQLQNGSPARVNLRNILLDVVALNTIQH